MQVRKEEDDKPPLYERLNVEVFEIGEKNEVKRVKDFALKKQHGEEWSWKPKKYNADGGYFNHAQCACNGRVLILALPHRAHFFDVEREGVRFRSTAKRGAETYC